MNPSGIKTIFFDYDGTLHNSLGIYKPAFLQVFKMLVDEKYMTMREWSDDEISPFLGQSPKEMWDQFGQGLPEQVKTRASNRLGAIMYDLITQQKAYLYEGAIDTLDYLKRKGYKLIFISNCRHEYMIYHTKMFNLDHYFDLMVNAEMYDYQPKEAILAKIKGDFPEEMVIVGDRHHDIKAGKDNEIYTIACSYGYGVDEEIKLADHQINDIRELKNLL